MRRNEHNRIMSGSMDYICERIATAYIETGRTMRSLAKLYNCSKSTINNYLNKYARDHLSYDLYQQVRGRAEINMAEVYELGRSQNSNSDQYGSLD